MTGTRHTTLDGHDAKGDAFRGAIVVKLSGRLSQFYPLPGANMGNLGKYQDIVTAAKHLGGVDNLIETIEAGAVAKAAPRLLFKGAAIIAACTSVLAVGVVAGKRVWNKYKAREVAANEAKERLRTELAEHMTADHGDADRGEGLIDVDEGRQP